MKLGDVIYLEANSGSVKRVGRCDAYASEFDLEAEEYVPLPKGDVHKERDCAGCNFTRFGRRQRETARRIRYHFNDESNHETEENRDYGKVKERNQ